MAPEAGICEAPNHSFFLLLKHRFHSISFTRAQGIPKYKIGFGRDKDGRVGERLVEGGGGHGVDTHALANTHTSALENTHTHAQNTHTHSFLHALTLGHILHQHHRAVVVHLDGRRIRGGYEGHLPSELGCILVDFEHLHTNPKFTSEWAGASGGMQRARGLV